MLGWLSIPAARASCSKRRSRSAFCEKAAGRNLIAISRPSLVSRAIDLAHRPRPKQSENLVRTRRCAFCKRHMECCDYRRFSSVARTNSGDLSPHSKHPQAAMAFLKIVQIAPGNIFAFFRANRGWSDHGYSYHLYLVPSNRTSLHELDSLVLSRRYYDLSQTFEFGFIFFCACDPPDTYFLI